MYWVVNVTQAVTIAATNAYARVTPATPTPADPKDIGEFTISRGEGSTDGALKVYYTIDTTNLPPNDVLAIDGTDYQDIVNGQDNSRPILRHYPRRLLQHHDQDRPD